jgi:ankyrin repeat protein
MAGEVEEVRDLLEANTPDVNYMDSEKRSPLHCAAFRGEGEMVEMLISQVTQCCKAKMLQFLHCSTHRSLICSSAFNHNLSAII